MTALVRRSGLLLVAAMGIALSRSAGQSSSSAPADSALERRTSEVASRLRCPVCQGLSVQDSPSQLAQELRAVVRDQLRAGKTPDEVTRYFVERYGEWVLLEPTRAGFNWLVYLLPLGLLLAGGGVIVLAVRRWTRAPEPENPAPGA